MNNQQNRSAIKALAQQLLDTWVTPSAALDAADLTPDCQFHSSHQGTAQGYNEITSLLASDTEHGAMLSHMTNLYVGVEENQAAFSFYMYGVVEQAQRAFMFGSTVVASLSFQEGRWRLHEIRLVVNWSKGDQSLMPHWRNVPTQYGWQMGFAAPAIVPELHSPWVKLAHVPPPEDLHDAISELYYRYAFAVDQNDMALLARSYTDDISGGFAPVGNLSGKDQVIGTLKNFRHLAAFWQHFAEVVKVEEVGDGRHVNVIVGRIIPERPVDEQGNKLYGAHYQLRARCMADGQWKFCWTDYRPGWFTQHSLPAFDIGNATA
ncbi:nuclear transport factor 2 family protein [Marinomonas ostreistagni]|uniref:nuclear transport factor 2 family protein n=1 Tax=Marinomonas ostreistagni TaxID=359209 RepID=UPI0019523754|nr:nuclear transport factor 2 family protein [Marinomonas ostreistagni]MBM6550060.1 nuclear transport factor 2 family protein [Marinomonas ostreistagni]